MLQLLPADPAQHSELIAHLIQQAFAEQAAFLKLRPEQYPNFVGFETPERAYWRLTHGDTAILAQLDDNIIGTVSYQPITDNSGTGYIKRLGVLPAYRGYEYGLTMMSYAEAQLKQHEIYRAEISIVAEFTRLHQYYKQQGYEDGNLTSVPVLPFMVQYLYKHLV